MLNDVGFLAQLVGVIALGSFAGELRRNTVADTELILIKFIAAILGGAFLSFLIAYAIYEYRGDKPLAFIIGGYLAYQDEAYVMKQVSAFVSKFLDKGGSKKDA